MQALGPFYEKKLTCLYCNKDFTTLRVRSRASVPYKIDSDFCPHYRAGSHNPHFYYVNVCPECGFAFSEEFSSHFPPGSKEILRVKIVIPWGKREQKDFCHTRDLQQAIDSYKLAIYAGSLKQEKHAALAGLCLRLAWIYRTENNPEQEQRFTALALKEYEDSYLYSDFNGTSMSEMKVLFIIGELSRRLGDYAKAIAHFAKVIDHPNRNDEIKMVNMAREQWVITVEQHREQRKNNPNGNKPSS